MTSYYDEDCHVERCTYCARWLVHWKYGQPRETQPFDLAAKAGMWVLGPFPHDGSVRLVAESAYCLRWRCRLRHWWASKA